MKKTILTAIIALTLVTGISTTSIAATRTKTSVSTLVSEVNSFNQIEVHGNVKVYLTSGETDKVKVYNNYYGEDALVQEKNGVLRVTSYGAEQLEVWVTVADLTRLSAFDRAEIVSFGKFSAIDLALELHDTAKASLDLDAIKTSLFLGDHAKADLNGFAETASVHYNRSAYLNTANFSAAKLTTTRLEQIECRHTDELVSL
jgi:hypothetical protein